MHVGAEHGSLQAAFHLVRAVVAMAELCLAQRPRLWSEISAAAVIFETHQRFRVECFDFGLDDDVADEPLLARLSAHVDHADARESLAIGGLVVAPQELIAAAHGEDDGAVFYSLFERWLLELEKVLVDERLLAVLTASEKEDVDLVHLLGRPAPELDEPGLEAAPFGALQEREDVAAVAVDVHEVGIEPPDREFLTHLSKSASKAWPSLA